MLRRRGPRQLSSNFGQGHEAMGEYQPWNNTEFEKTNRLSKNPCYSFGLLKHNEKRIFIRPVSDRVVIVMEVRIRGPSIYVDIAPSPVSTSWMARSCSIVLLLATVM